jgi:hypothetical protein
MAVDLMARTRPTLRWRQVLKLAAIFSVGLFAILTLVDAGIITPHAGRCPSQFPKWFACILANHETLLGSLIAAVAALLAARFAWHAIMAQIDSDRAIAHKADRAYVTGGPGRRLVDESKNHIGIVILCYGGGQKNQTRFLKIGGGHFQIILIRARERGAGAPGWQAAHRRQRSHQ